MPSTPKDSPGVRRSPRLVNKPMSNYHEGKQDRRRIVKKTKRSNLKATEASDSQVGTTKTAETAEEVEYITIDEEDLEPANNSFFEEVDRDFQRGEQPRQEVVGTTSQDDSTLGVITIEEVDRGNQENEEEVLTQHQLDEFFHEVNRDYNRVNPPQLSQEDASVTLDDSVLILPQAEDSSMEDANRNNSDSLSNIQDDSIDSLLNDTITSIDDLTVDNSLEEPEVIDLTTATSPAAPQVASVLPSLNETVEEEICPVCHDTFENIEKEGILRVKLVCRHVFCHSCLVGCMTVNNHCPVCRAIVRAGDNFIVYV